jgi:signal transduction histidine kinase
MVDLRATPAGVARTLRPVDVLGGVVAAGFMLLATSHLRATGGERSADALMIVLLVVAGGSLMFCRSRPWVPTVLTALASGWYLAANYPGGPIYATVWIALGFLGYRVGVRTGLLAAAGVACWLVAVSVAVGRGPLLVHLVFIGWSAAAVLLGDVGRGRRERVVRLQERTRELERTRDEETRRRLAEDRLAIARDLHDSVAHAMATISVQAGAAAHVVDRRPEAAKEALEAIQRASSDVLDELGAMLTVLRRSRLTADRAPTPGIERLADLVASTKAAGITADLEVTGDAASVPPTISTAVFRVAQESLTNVARHAPGSRARVRLAVHASGIELDVSNDGAARSPVRASPLGAGVGVLGMRERVESTGGRFVAGPIAGGGFRVRAEWDRPA